MMPRRIAVIGSGVSGLVCARMLSARHDVRLFEASDRLGGHAHTVDFDADGRQMAADVGFMVFNRRTYPNFTRLLELLGIDSQASDMSFSVRADSARLEYQSGSLWARRRNAISPRFWRMLWDIVRFNRDARGLLADADTQASLRDVLGRGGYGDAFWHYYLLPMTAAIWSAPPARVEEFPAHFLLGFLDNHGLLSLRDRPQWLTIPGGSRRYVDALAKPLGRRILLNSPVRTVRRAAGGVEVAVDGRPPEQFDAAVLAVHAPQSLAMLADATPAERAALSAFDYQPNDAALHTDAGLMPRRRRAWASWNFLAGEGSARPPAVTYDLNRLQRLGAARPICVTLNPPRPVASNHLITPLRFEHPLYTAAAIEAQQRRNELHRDGRVYFCGAYWGYGFHEDGVASALAVGRHFGVTLDDVQRPPCTVASTLVASPTCGTSR